MKTVGILGLGEVGQAIQKLASPHYQIFTKDLDHDQLSGHIVDILHICIPFNAEFVPHVVKIIKAVKPSLVIINSTVKPGTSREIYTQTNIPIAHTPIMGVHPHLADYQKHFTKVIGPINDEAYQITKAHWEQLGAPQILRFNRPEESELAKLIDTTYYGWNIVFNKLVHRLCKKEGFDFSQVYTQFNQVYNDGYRESKPNVIRPTLDYVDGPIGGHCVIPNLAILKQMFADPTFEWMMDFNDQLAEKK